MERAKVSKEGAFVTLIGKVDICTILYMGGTQGGSRKKVQRNCFSFCLKGVNGIALFTERRKGWESIGTDVTHLRFVFV